MKSSYKVFIKNKQTNIENATFYSRGPYIQIESINLQFLSFFRKHHHTYIYTKLILQSYDFGLYENLIPGYLGVSSPLRPLTCNDTPQVAIRCFLGAFIGRLLGPHIDIFKPCVSWSSSRSLPLDSSFNCHCQNIILPFYVAIISSFSRFYLIKERSFSAESA